MEKDLLQTISKYHGWDRCEHTRIRRFCPECKWEVPTFMRNEEPENSKIAVPIINELIESKLTIYCSRCGIQWMVGDRERTDEEKADWVCPSCEIERTLFEKEREDAKDIWAELHGAHQNEDGEWEV